VKGFFLVSRVDPEIVVCCENRPAIKDDRSATDNEISDFSPIELSNKVEKLNFFFWFHTAGGRSS
jgi:hypothetical protein